MGIVGMSSSNIYARLKNHIIHQPQRYKQKGYGLPSIFQLVIFFMILPKICYYGWSYLLQNVSVRNIYFYGTILTNLGVHNMGFIFYYFVYTKKINLQKYRIAPQRSWPWQKNKSQWYALLFKTFKYILFNNYLFLPLVTYIDSFSISYKYKLQQWPTFQLMIYQFFIFQIFQMVTNFIFHGLFHHPYIYKFHKLHHEYTTSITLTSLYFHPVQFIFTTLITGSSGSMYLGSQVHLFTLIMWIFYKSFSNIDSHCGYELPWSPLRLLPYSISSQYHFFHHSHNVGTFDAGGCILDTITGYNEEYFKYLDNKAKRI